MVPPPEHRLAGIPLVGASRFVATCSCGWRGEPMMNAGLAGALYDRHVAAVVPPPPPPDVPRGSAEAARLLYADLVPTIKDAVRRGEAAGVAVHLERLAAAAAVLGDREERLAGAVRREWNRLVEEPTSRQRATVVVGLVELADRARQKLVAAQAFERSSSNASTNRPAPDRLQ